MPAVKETNPRAVFERLFRGGEDAPTSAARAERLARRRSVLDFVRDDVGRLWPRLGSGDRERLLAYLEGVREHPRDMLKHSGI